MAGYKPYLLLQKALNLYLITYIFRFSDLPTDLHYSSFDRYIFVYVLVKFCDVAKKLCIIIVEKKETSIFLHRARFAYISSYVHSSNCRMESQKHFNIRSKIGGQEKFFSHNCTVQWTVYSIWWQYLKGHFYKELPYEMNGNMKGIWAEFMGMGISYEFSQLISKTPKLICLFFLFFASNTLSYKLREYWHILSKHDLKTEFNLTS